jgi:murein endopeptidase
MLAPHPVPRLGGALATAAAMPADYVYQVMRENERRKKKGLPPITKPVEEIQYDPMGNPIR